MKQERLTYDRYDRLCAFRKGLKQLVKEPMPPGDRLRLFTYLRSTGMLISRIEKTLSFEFIGDYNQLFLVNSKNNLGDNYALRSEIKRNINHKAYCQKYHKEVYPLRRKRVLENYRRKHDKIFADPVEHEKLKAKWREKKRKQRKPPPSNNWLYL